MDTIFAPATARGKAGLAVIRLSGPLAWEAAGALCGHLPEPRRAVLRRLTSAGELLDEAVVITFEAGASFTGEKVAELHLHGSPATVAAVLAALGGMPELRLAEPGEFTRRAFENGRIDLTQAEALADLIAAETEAQRDQALANAGGRLRHLADGWRDRLLGLMADVEAHLDFSDEGDVAASESGNLAPARIAIAALADEISEALVSAPLAERVRHGLTIAIIGPPNAGKSSLLNRLAARDVAIVTPIAGTTRDVIEVHLDLGGRAALLIDTAGLRDTSDPVEAEGIARARTRAAGADLVLDMSGEGRAKSHILNVRNRIDESGEQPGVRCGTAYISALTGAGLGELEQWLVDWAAAQFPTGEPPLVTSARQSELLTAVQAALADAAADNDPLLQAESLRRAAESLGRLTGRFDPEQLLGAIFSRFCIGK